MQSILSPQELTQNPGLAMAETKALAMLHERGFQVPAFVVVQAEALRAASTDPARAGQIASEVRASLPGGPYTIDGEGPVDDLEQAIRARAGEASALRIQRSIPADVRGVTFTRDPAGGREMRMQWRRGDTTQSAAWHWNGKLPRTGLPDLAYAAREWKRIEEALGAPQEIAWHLWKKDWYVLSVRPLPGITPDAHALQKMLDTTLPQRRFLYESTELTEMAPHPSPITLSLLRRIYSAGGPVEAAYTRLGFRYRPGDALKMIGGALYVDREAEMQSLLPAFSSFPGGVHIVRRITGGWMTVRNIAALHRIHPDALVQQHRSAVLEALTAVRGPLGLRAALEQFSAMYPAVAAVDIASAKALLQLTRALKGESIPLPVLMASALTPLEPLPGAPQGLIGNTLELADLSPFSTVQLAPSAQWDATQWWESLSEARRTQLEPLLKTAQEYAALREAGRWLTVSLTHVLRDAVLTEAKRQHLDRSLAYDATLEEYLNETVQAELCAKRQTERLPETALMLPVRLSHTPTAPQAHPQGVSPGTATGMLVTPETIASAQGPVVLAVTTPSADLTRHLPRIGGVIAAHGGLLSHLAIIARGRRIPMVTGVSLTALGIQPGDVVDVNGTKGEVRVLKKLSTHNLQLTTN